MKRYILPLIAIAMSVAACKDPYEGQMFEVDDGDDTKLTNIAYMEKHPETYSMFLAFLHRADYYNALNDASTTTTVFAPDNDAMKAFMEQKSVSSLEELDSLYSRQVIQVHLLRQAVTENSFIQYLNEGSISIPTVFGDYLQLAYGYVNTDVDDDERADAKRQDTLSIYINNMASVKEMAHQTANGMVYRVGGVIRPLIETVIDKLHDYGTYTVLLDAIEEAGLTEELEIANDTVWQPDGSYVVNQVRHTILAVDDETFRQKGISSVDALENWLSGKDEGGKSGISRSDSTSVIKRYVLYHIFDGSFDKSALTYTATVGEIKLTDTRQPNEIITFQTLVGETFINGESDEPCSFVRSDIQAANGYIHKISGVLPIFCPEPQEVIWDFCNSTDVISLVNNYGARNNLGNLFETPCDVTEYTVSMVRNNAYGTITSFEYQTASPKSSQPNVAFFKCKANTDPTYESDNSLGAYLNNLLIVNLGYTGSITFSTPTLIKGKYRVEFYYAGWKPLAKKFYGPGSTVKITLDDYIVKYQIWKGWATTKVDVGGGILFPSVEFESTGTHDFKAVIMDAAASTNANYYQRWDYIKFTPIE